MGRGYTDRYHSLLALVCATKRSSQSHLGGHVPYLGRVRRCNPHGVRWRYYCLSWRANSPRVARSAFLPHSGQTFSLDFLPLVSTMSHHVVPISDWNFIDSFVCNRSISCVDYIRLGTNMRLESSAPHKNLFFSESTVRTYGTTPIQTYNCRSVLWREI